MTSGVADHTRTARSPATADAQLKLHLGYRDSTATNAVPEQISPNTNGSLFDALFTTAAGANESAKAGGFVGPPPQQYLEDSAHLFQYRSELSTRLSLIKHR